MEGCLFGALDSSSRAKTSIPAIDAARVGCSTTGLEITALAPDSDVIFFVIRVLCSRAFSFKYFQARSVFIYAHIYKHSEPNLYWW